MTQCLKKVISLWVCKEKRRGHIKALLNRFILLGHEPRVWNMHLSISPLALYRTVSLTGRVAWCSDRWDSDSTEQTRTVSNILINPLGLF